VGEKDFDAVVSFSFAFQFAVRVFSSLMRKDACWKTFPSMTEMTPRGEGSTVEFSPFIPMQTLKLLEWITSLQRKVQLVECTENAKRWVFIFHLYVHPLIGVYLQVCYQTVYGYDSNSLPTYCSK